MRRKNEFLVTLLLGAVLLCFSQCSSKSEDQANVAKSNHEVERNIVDTIHLTKGAFCKETISNGVLRGASVAQVRFAAQGQVCKVCVKNGSRVRVGDIIAVLDKEAAQLDAQKALSSLEKAALDFYDVLIGFGYGRDTSNVPKDVLNIAKIRSGYTMALNTYNQSQINLKNTVLTSPIGGVVANLKINAHEFVNGDVCMVIDDSSFKVEFPVLEGELSNIALGHKVKIHPFSDLGLVYNGTISEINPCVDSKGQIKVFAEVSGANGKLLDGMNVKVVIQNMTDGHLIVPKSAVVMRDGFDVLFVYDEKASVARWRYIEVLQSNSAFHVIGGNKVKRSEIHEGEAVIVSGNLNLADGSSVEINRRK